MILAQNRPKFTTSDATGISAEYFGRKVAAKELPGERDQNFLISDEGGSFYVLKIANPDEEYAVLSFQNEGLCRIEAYREGLNCPRVQPFLDGELIAQVTDKKGRSYLIRVLSYLPGLPLAEAKPHSADLLHNVGHFLGELDNALIGYNHTAAIRQLQWKVQESPGVIRDHISLIEDGEKRAILKHFLLSFEEHALPMMPYLRSGIIHNDGNDYNVLVDERSLPATPAIGLIDFGDMVYGPYVNEPAVAAAYVMMGKGDPLAAAVQLMGGYNEAFPLSEQEVNLLFDFICIRLCTSVVLSAFQRRQDPGNVYLSISEAQAWDLLARLHVLDPKGVAEHFRAVCRMSPFPKKESLISGAK